MNEKASEIVARKLVAMQNYAREIHSDATLGPDLRALAQLADRIAGELMDLAPEKAATRLHEFDLGITTFGILLRDGTDAASNAYLDAIARQFLRASLKSFGGGTP